MTDCLIIGHNDGNFAEYVGMVRSMGEESGAFRDLRLAFLDLDGPWFKAFIWERASQSVREVKLPAGKIPAAYSSASSCRDLCFSKSLFGSSFGLKKSLS